MQTVFFFLCEGLLKHCGCGRLGLSSRGQLSSCSLLPEAPGARADVRRSPAAVVVRDALRAAKVLGQEVQLVHGWLEGQLVQALLGGA